MERKGESSLGLKSKVSVELLVALAPVFFALVVLIIQVRSISGQLRNGWTVSNMAVWSERLQSDNPGIKVPKPFDVKHMMEPETTLFSFPIQTP